MPDMDGSSVLRVAPILNTRVGWVGFWLVVMVKSFLVFITFGLVDDAENWLC